MLYFAMKMAFATFWFTHFTAATSIFCTALESHAIRVLIFLPVDKNEMARVKSQANHNFAEA
jgi:hypothetical protein